MDFKKDFFAFNYADQKFIYDINNNKQYIVSETLYDAFISNKFSIINENFLKLISTQTKKDNDKKYHNRLTELINSFSCDLTTIYVYVSNKCNLKCDYCFVNKNNKTLQINIIKKNIINVIKHVHSKNLEIRFFGGEPLLFYNHLKALIDFFSHEFNGIAKVKYFISSNGTIMSKEIIELLKNKNINLKITMDGNSHEHNSMRKFIDGSDSYKIIRSNIINLIKNDFKNLTVTITIGRYNLDLFEYVNEFLEMGINSIRWQFITHKDYSINIENINKLKQQISYIAQSYLEKIKKGIFYNLTNLTGVMQQLILNQQQVLRCKAGVNSITLDTEGKIYICQRFVNNINMQIGDIKNGIDEKKVKTIITKSNLNSLQDCKICWIKYFCAGQCYYNNLYLTNDYNKPYSAFCEIIKEYFKTAIWLIHNLIESNHENALHYLIKYQNFIH